VAENYVKSSKWVDFIDISDKINPKRTKTWLIFSKNGGFKLGEVKWYASWRQYCFFAAVDTIWNMVCLDDVTVFLDAQNRAHKDSLQAAAAMVR
jgi:hypothetical protein